MDRVEGESLALAQTQQWNLNRRTSCAQTLDQAGVAVRRAGMDLDDKTTDVAECKGQLFHDLIGPSLPLCDRFAIQRHVVRIDEVFRSDQSVSSGQDEPSIAASLDE